MYIILSDFIVDGKGGNRIRINTEHISQITHQCFKTLLLEHVNHFQAILCAT